MMQLLPQQRAAVAPSATGRLVVDGSWCHCAERDDEGGKLLRCRFTAMHDHERRRLFGLFVRCHSGMFPCFLGGSVSRLVRSRRRARTSSRRVVEGGMTASTYPRSAAMYGLAKWSS